jgi:hypothetical protein
MSAGAIFREALSILTRYRLPEISQRDLVAALEAGRTGPLPFLYEAGGEAGLPRQILLTRTAAIYFCLCAVSLSDDLTDGECTYLSDPFRSGPCTQLILQTLFLDVLAGANLPNSILSTAAHDLILCGGAQHLEIRTKRWKASIFREVTEGIAGRLWAAYLRILWHGTSLAERAVAIGMNIGRSASVWDDIRSNDPRYTTMPEADKREILAWALAAAEALHKERLSCLDPLLRVVIPVLRRGS